VRHSAALERHALADTLAAAGPDAPTLSSPWTTADLAAHLVLREATPVELLAQLRIPAVTRAADRAVTRYARRTPYADLVQHVRVGPPWYSPTALPPVRELVNLLEYVIHHEDVRRARPGWTVASRPLEVQRDVWRRIPRFAGATLRRVPVGVRFEAPGFGTADVRSGAAPVTVRGEPVELALVAYGRQRVARVDYAGDADAVARLRDAAVPV
jgi:uncharacterized protein (TIGR03085 family)